MSRTFFFCAVAQTSSFTRAAQRERLAQPSLSQQIRKLEDELGTRLFDRLGRVVRLTSLGEAFLPRAEAILRQLADAKQEIEEMSGAERGKLVIGSIPRRALPFTRLALAARKRSDRSLSSTTAVVRQSLVPKISKPIVP
jgi:LysR family hydrogen peroxide-inducible transcriptional activator